MTRPAYRITLTPKERQDLEGILRTGTHPAHQTRHARILLEADTSPRRARRSGAQVAERCGVSSRTVARVRQTRATDGLDLALQGRKRRGGRPKLEAAQAARLVALARSEPPDGYAGWSLRLLARPVELVAAPPVCAETIRRTRKQTTVPGTGSSAG